LFVLLKPLSDNNSEEQWDLEGDWVGMATLFGPVSKETYEFPKESGGPEIGSDQDETRWHMTGLYYLQIVAERG
jgi:hypothetical protein